MIQYLAPTLEQHKGCTLIDIHPGACLWSSKLHDFLKPRRHLLMEPDKDYFEPFIKPLLDKPGSTYRHTPLAGAHPRAYWDNYAKVLGDPELAPREALPLDDPRRRQLDPSFLVIGNLARQYRVSYRARSVSFGSMILQQMLTAALGNDIFHRGGLVRMLWWLPESEKPTLLPATEMHRHSINVRLSAASTLSEVVGCMPLNDMENHLYSTRKRPEELEAYTAQQVGRSMREQGIQKPDDRKFLCTHPETDLSQLVSPLETDVRNAADLQAEVDAVQERVAQVTKLGAKTRARSAQEAKLMTSLQFPHVAAIAKASKKLKSLGLSIITIFGDLGLRLVRLEVGLKILEEKGEDAATLEDLRERVLSLNDDVLTHMASKTRDFAQMYSQLVDEHIAVFMKPPLIALDARSYEPLQAAPNEFWPTNQLTLLDMVPKSRDLSVPDLATAAEGTRVCNMLMKHVMQGPAGLLPATLERLAPNASKDLLPQVPSATDPRKGGRLNANQIRNRMLSEDIIEGLVKAWIEWPFKPSDMDLMLAAEAASEAGVMDEPEAVSEV